MGLARSGVLPRLVKTGSPWQTFTPGLRTSLIIHCAVFSSSNYCVLGMVHCGRPSAGCGVCRARKIKCDQARPTCSQCWVATRACPGYRDQQSLMFRNETAAVIQKAKGNGLAYRASRGKMATPEPAQPLLWSNESVYGDQCPSLSPYLLNTITSDCIFQAICFFFSSFSDLTTTRLAKDCMCDGTLPETASGERALKASIASVGLANLANLHNSSDILRSAKKSYSVALNAINAALGDPMQTTQDTTLAAILCIFLYEIIIFEQPRSLDAWLIHTQGATALLEIRGGDQFQRQTGFHLFHAVRNEVLLGCLQRGERFPESMTKFPDNIAATSRTETLSDYKNDLTEITVMLCNLQAAIKDGYLQEAREILLLARSIDSQPLSFSRRFFARFPYKIHKWTDRVSNIWRESANVSHYDRCFHVYTSSEASNIWNNYRCARILVNRLIVTSLCPWERQNPNLAGNSGFENCGQISRSVSQQLAMEICLSVPFRLGLSRNGNTSTTRFEMMNSAAGVALIFPLYLAATVDGYPSPVCLWVMTCFNFLGRFIGINAALILLKTLPKAPGFLMT
ncbi:unnamed protein product [Penicillium salamii]|nr:unnamed protein product [Penicillium salamii]CAG8397392.1 unnamed protein product [Penicillium salamii]